MVAMAARFSPCTPTPFHPNASPCPKSGLVRRHAEQSALLYKHLRPCSLSALLEFIPFSIPGCKQKLYIFFFLSGQLISCHVEYLLPRPSLAPGRDVLRTASPRFGEILNMTGCLPDKYYPYPKCRNSLCKWMQSPPDNEEEKKHAIIGSICPGIALWRFSLSSLSFALSLHSKVSPLFISLLPANVTLHRLYLAYSHPILVNIHMHIQYAVARKWANERMHHVVKPYKIYYLANMLINSIHYAIYAVLCKKQCNMLECRHRPWSHSHHLSPSS
ncbi:hypothetical protein CI102_8789 [Trichoderma harzianum]|nr:hypothetical protein CI102_8789 [Trichoderma harzianum]